MWSVCSTCRARGARHARGMGAGWVAQAGGGSRLAAGARRAPRMRPRTGTHLQERRGHARARVRLRRQLLRRAGFEVVVVPAEVRLVAAEGRLAVARMGAHCACMGDCMPRIRAAPCHAWRVRCSMLARQWLRCDPSHKGTPVRGSCLPCRQADFARPRHPERRMLRRGRTRGGCVRCRPGVCAAPRRCLAPAPCASGTPLTAVGCLSGASARCSSRGRGAPGARRRLRCHRRCGAGGGRRRRRCHSRPHHRRPTRHRRPRCGRGCGACRARRTAGARTSARRVCCGTCAELRAGSALAAAAALPATASHSAGVQQSHAPVVAPL